MDSWYSVVACQFIIIVIIIIISDLQWPALQFVSQSDDPSQAYKFC